MNSTEKIIDSFFGSNDYPVQWKDEEEKKLHWFFDDGHCPYPISPLYFDCAGWWGSGLTYMYQRFGFPGGKHWIAKKINGYVYSAVIPRTEQKEIDQLGPYFFMVFPVYAENFLTWWKKRYLPEILINFKYLDNFNYEKASMGELMIHVEETMDIFDRNFKIHWIVNLAQFFANLLFQGKYQEVMGSVDNDNIGKILVSKDDRNWDSLKALYEMKEFIKNSPSLSALFKKPSEEIVKEVASAIDGTEFLKMLTAYQGEYGYKTIYPCELIYPTWKEDPTPIYSALKTYFDTDYNFYDAYDKCRNDQKKAINELMSKVNDPVKKEELQKSLDLAVKMSPLTPNHHFYIDQGTWARMRLVFKEVGKALVKTGAILDCEDVFMFKYDEMRALSANPNVFDAKSLVAERRKEMEDAKKIHPREWFGTITQWSLYEEPYKSLWGWPHKYEQEVEENKKTAAQRQAAVTSLKGLPASPGVVEGIARYVTSPAEFDRIQKGDIIVCKMTNPAWVVCFTKISGLVTDSGGATCHTAIVSREFGIPCVVGTAKATSTIKTGTKIRVNGNTGIVDILD
jgi:phosphohistidine swiveling domain-containing protein